MSNEGMPSTPRSVLQRRALLLVWIGLLWNLVEVVVALWAGLEANSVALLAFGLKSVIELVAGSVLVWRLRAGWDDEGEEGEAERRAEKVVGVTFLLLAVYIGVNAGLVLMGWLPRPESSIPGIAIALSSVAVMSLLYVGKMRIAVPLRSWALRGEALESLMCDVQDLTILVGVGFNLVLGWWWADPVATLALIPFLVKEGRENLQGHHEEGEDGHEAAQVCFCGSCVYGLARCKAACCAA